MTAVFIGPTSVRYFLSISGLSVFDKEPAIALVTGQGVLLHPIVGMDQIVELNGATSEATSIYDPRNSLFSAYRTLFRQWSLVFAIGARNGANGHAPSSLAALCGIRDNIRLLRYRIHWRINVHGFVSSKVAGILSRDESRRKTGPLYGSCASD
jgi:hypothetical protein